MDSKLSSSRATLVQIRDAVQCGDWDVAARLSQTCPLGDPGSDLECSALLLELHETVVAARMARAYMVASLNRRQAASSFHASLVEVADSRQIPGDPAYC